MKQEFAILREIGDSTLVERARCLADATARDQSELAMIRRELKRRRKDKKQ